MNKEEVLTHLRSAKAAHIKWVERARLLINGVKIDESSIPVNSTECKFGQWFYTDGQVLNSLSNNPLECMQNIEQLHSKLHGVYMQIFKIYFNDTNKSFFSKFFKTSKKITPEEATEALNYYKELEIISTELLEELNRLERRLVAVSEEKIAKLV